MNTRPAASEPVATVLKDLIRPYTGPIAEIQPTTAGNQSATTLLVTSQAGRYFVKAVSDRPGGRRDSLLREAAINPYVRPIAPALRWQAREHGWIALGFDRVDGVHAEFTPGSPELPAVIDLLDRIGRLPLPEIARDWHETRWDRYATSSGRFTGGALLYTDIQPANLLLGDHGAAWAVDWSWPTRGTAVITPACLAVQLIAAGHEPGHAENLIAGLSAWITADPGTIEAFLSAYLRMYETAVARDPGAGWLGDMATAIRRWQAYRRE